MKCHFYQSPGEPTKYCLVHQMSILKDTEICEIGKLEERISKVEEKLAILELQNGWDKR